MLESSGVIKVTASLSSANSEDIHVSFKFDGTAVFDTDYSFSPNEGINSPKLTNTDQYYIIIPAGQTQKTVNITAIDDSNIEVEETIEIEIGEVSDCASIGTSKKKNLRLLDDDLVISLVLLSGEDTVLEEEGSLKSRLQVTANANVPEDVEVLINFSPITASSSDVVFTSTVKIDDGTSNSSPFDIYALDDAVYEDNESFYLTHTILSGTGTISNDTISFSITDNEPPLVSFSIDKTEIDEDGGEAILTITLSRTYDHDSKVALNYEGLNFTAENNVDFQSDKSDVITISAGNTQSTVKISAIDDQIEDPNENIVNENDEGDSLFIILSGNARVFINKDGKDIFMQDIWPSNKEIEDVLKSSLNPEMFVKRYSNVSEGPKQWQQIKTEKSSIYNWEENSTYVKKPPFFENLPDQPEGFKKIHDARPLLILGDMVTTDHISPAGNIQKESPTGEYFMKHQILPKDYNSYGARRGNHEVMMRGTFANIRIRNEMAPGTEGGFTTLYPEKKVMPIYDAVVEYKKRGTDLVLSLIHI